MKEYWKARLPAKEQAVYNALHHAIIGQKSTVEIAGIDYAKLPNILSSILRDHPQLYNVSPQLGVNASLFKMCAQLQYLYGAADKKKIDAYIVEYQRKISALKTLQDVKAELKIVEDLALSVSYAINDVYNQNAAAALYYKQAQCSGIAGAFKWSMDFLGIPCITVNGTVKDPGTNTQGPHAWNIVQIDGVFYHVDVTMMIGANMAKKKPLFYHLINCSDAKLQQNGYQWDVSSTPRCSQDMDLSAFIQSPQYSSAAKTSASVHSTAKTGNAREFNRLYEVNGAVEECLAKRQERFECILNVSGYSAEKLLRLLLNIAKEKAQKLNLALSINGQVTNDYYTLTFTY